jgi:hypothetical protein
MTRADIHEYIDEELDRIEFEKTFRQRWGKLWIEFVYENGEVVATVGTKEHKKKFKMK